MKENNQQKNLVELDANYGIQVYNIIETTTTESVIDSKTSDILKQPENKEIRDNNHNSENEEDESIISKPGELLQQPKETPKNAIQHKPVIENAASKLHSYLDNLPYHEGQWSVKNPTGKKVYSKLFLIQLGSEAVCQKKPDVLRNWTNLTNFSSEPHLSSLGKPGAKDNSRKRKKVSVSLREEVKLNQSQNAWVPTAVEKATKSVVVKTKNEEEQKNDELNRSVRSILNKITLDNMASLIENFKALPIDTIERLEKTIDLVFEKAIEEQSFAPLYSSLCSAMQFVQVRSKYGKTVTFKKLLISKCQSLFELDKDQEMDSAKKLTEINSCEDPKKKKELQLEFEENKRRIRKRSVGNCRFMGELFKQKILSPNIMLHCIMNLVTKHVEERLECLCNLLRTVGKELEQSYNLNDTFDKLKALTSRNMKSKISSRLKFMIQDVIDLRRNKWIPRHTESKPKMINEIENDIKSEAIKQQSISLAYNRPEQQDHRRGDDKCRRGKNKNHCGYKNEPRHTENKPKMINEIENDITSEAIKQQSISLAYNRPEQQDHRRGDDKCRRGKNKNHCGYKNEPRHTENKPKMINEIENDITSEAIKQQSISLAYNRPEQQDHRRGGDKFRQGKNKSHRGYKNDPKIFQNNTKYKQHNYTIDHSKLQCFKENTSVTTLGQHKLSFTTVKSMTFTNSNPYAVLNNDNKSTNSSLIILNKNTSRKQVISEAEERQRMMSGLASMMTQFAQPTSSKNYSSLQPRETVEEPVLKLLDTEMANKINMICKNILLEYEQIQNLDDIIYLLLEDKTSVIRTRHEEFVKSMSLITLDSSPITRTTEAGKIFAELLSKKIVSVEAITRGIDAVLKDWNDHLMDYPQFFSYIAAIIAPLLLSPNASFNFNNLKDSCTSIRPDHSSKFFTEVLNKVLSSMETQTIKEEDVGCKNLLVSCYHALLHLGGILWIYNKWKTSEYYVPLDVFMPNNQINKYFENNRIGVFLLSIAMYDEMRMTDSKPLYNLMHSWISTYISAEIIKYSQFVRALTIAIIIVCLKPNHSYEDIFDHIHMKLLKYYIWFEPLPEPEIQAKEIQCLYGIQIMSAALEHPRGMLPRLFHKLYQDNVVSKKSFELWKKEDKFKAGFNEDLETKTIAVQVSNSFFLSLAANYSDKEKTAE